ncbi:MAG: segregation/condensation protein A [Planctomycetes bacterium]|nr:segregation/condensation protein A [Planctomycetota bacterium]
MPYTVELEAFHGPLDLLLYLVKRNEVDVLDISLAKLADQFLAYIQAIKDLDIEFAGEFLVTAATLMEIKSRSLLPVDAPFADDDSPDPRRELVRQLLEYRKFKDAAAALEARAEEAGTRLARQEPAEPAPDRGPKVRAVELWDLVSAFARLMRETQALQPATIAVDDTPQHVYETRLRERVAAAGGRLGFRDAFEPPHFKARLIGIFLAILELIRHRGLGLEQPEPDGEIYLVELPAEDLPTAPPEGEPDTSPTLSPEP